MSGASHWGEQSPRVVAAQIVAKRTKEARQALWILIPITWRYSVGYNVALQLAPQICELRTLEERRLALDMVPDELRKQVEEEVRKAFLAQRPA